MRTLGLLGGMSWHSTVDYYRVLNEIAHAARGGHASAPLAVQSLDFAQVRALQVEGRWDDAAALLLDAARRTRDAGAEAVLICTNYMHRVADHVQAGLDVPLLRITDALAARAQHDGHRRVGLLGARGTMEGAFYLDALRAGGLEVLTPDAADRAEVDRLVFEELTLGVVSPRGRATFDRLLDEFGGRGADAVILGCTEIQLAVTPATSPLPLLDSLRVHAEYAAAWALRAPGPSPARPPVLPPVLPPVPRPGTWSEVPA
ncbi:aspartate/glutamate racemase family protein [Nocardioides sp.]|uniref:aspartate/glutamate racemase family protein n=1 Tax=Nocardioides sp. TaxID=35761 RepID=UPI0035173781